MQALPTIVSIYSIPNREVILTKMKITNATMRNVINSWINNVGVKGAIGGASHPRVTNMIDRIGVMKLPTN